MPIRFDASLLEPETAQRAKWWPKYFGEGKAEFDNDKIAVVSHEFPPTDDIPGETRYYVRIYDETFQPAYWYFRLTKDNLERVAELAGEPLPASLLLLKL